MDICNRVKIFRSNNIENLEHDINQWFERNTVLLVDIKFITDKGNYFTAMIIYQ